MFQKNGIMIHIAAKTWKKLEKMNEMAKKNVKEEEKDKKKKGRRREEDDNYDNDEMKK
jgi:hypothetical protein